MGPETVATATAEEGAVDEEEEPCHVCHQVEEGETLLLCEKCDRPAHKECVGLKKIPKASCSALLFIPCAIWNTKKSLATNLNCQKCPIADQGPQNLDCLKSDSHQSLVNIR